MTRAAGVLFRLKRNAATALIAAAILAAVAAAAARALDLRFRAGETAADAAAAVALGLAAIAASDGLLHAAGRRLLGERYLARYRALVAYFGAQDGAAVVAGGVLAAAEEVLFRGVLLEGLRSAGAGAATAVLAAAVPFGAAHLLPDRRLAPFGAWAVWEGALLGGLYVLSGSLAATALVHAAHDIGGFLLFRAQRRGGRGPGAPGES